MNETDMTRAFELLDNFLKEGKSALRNLHETSTHPKIPTLLQQLGHADLIPRFA